MKKHIAVHMVVIMCLLMSTVVLLSAQKDVRGLARLSGKVTDKQGNGIAQAEVLVKFLADQTRRREAFEKIVKTEEDGGWKMAGLQSGLAVVYASAPGFLPNQRRIEVSQVNRNPFILLQLEAAEVPVSEDPEAIRLFEEANSAFDAENFEEALALYQKFMEQNPEVYQIRFNIGNCYAETGQFDLALTEYEAVIAKLDKEIENPDIKLKAKSVAAIGEVYLKKQDLEKAQEYFKQSIELSPDDQILSYNVGEIYFSNNNMGEAVEYFSKAIEIKPDWADPYLKLGYVYLNQADYGMAKENFTKFMELAPDHPQAATVTGILDYLEKM